MKSSMAAVSLLVFVTSSRAQDPKVELFPQTGHVPYSLDAMALSADGKRAVTGASSGDAAILWDMVSGKKLQVFKGHRFGPNLTTLSENGSRILTANTIEGKAILWDAVSGRSLHEISLGMMEHMTAKADGNYVYARLDQLALSGDGKRLLTRAAKSSNDIVVWDADSGKPLSVLAGHAGPVPAMALSHDGRRALTGSWDKSVILWNTQSGQILRTLSGGGETVSHVAMSADGKRAASLTEDSQLTIWNLETGEPLHVIRDGKFSALVMSANGKRILYQSGLDKAILFDIDSASQVGAVASNSNGSCLTLSGDGKRILLRTGWSDIELWDAESVRSVLTVRGHIDQINAIVLDAINRRMLMTLYAGDALLWDSFAANQPAILKQPYRTVGIEISDDGMKVMTADYYGTVVLWNGDAGALITEYRADRSDIKNGHAALSSDGKRIFLASTDGKVACVDTETGHLLFTMLGIDFSTPIWVSRNGKRAFAGTAQGTKAIVWDVDAATALATIKVPSGKEIYPVALSADGEWCLTGHGDSTAILWEAKTGKKLRTFELSNRAPIYLELSRDKKLILACLDEGTVLLLDLASGAERQRFGGRDCWIEAVALTADCRTLLTTCRGIVTFWDVESGKELCQFLSLDRGKNWLVTTPQGFFDGTLDAQDLIAFHIPGTIDFIPIERLHDRFYRPGLLARILRREQQL